MTVLVLPAMALSLSQGLSRGRGEGGPGGPGTGPSTLDPTPRVDFFQNQQFTRLFTPRSHPTNSSNLSATGTQSSASAPSPVTPASVTDVIGTRPGNTSWRSDHLRGAALGSIWAPSHPTRSLRTSDKQEGAVVVDPSPGHDPQGVETLVVLVEVAEGQRGLASPEEHLCPLGLLQQHIWKMVKGDGLQGHAGTRGTRRGQRCPPA